MAPRLTTGLVALFLVTVACGRSSSVLDLRTGSDEPGVRITTVRDFTSSNHLRPAPADARPAISAVEAYRAVVASSIIPFVNGEPAQPDELLLGLFTNDERGPIDTVAWAAVFYDVEAPDWGGMNTVPEERAIVLQKLLVTVDAMTGNVMGAVSGVR